MLGNRYSQHSFAQIPDVRTARSQFDRSFGVKDTMGTDTLNPIFVDEILPGDTCNLNVNAFMRLATQSKPIMDNMYVDFFFFFVPSRLLWVNWEKFNGAQDNPGDTTDYTIPTIPVTMTTSATGNLYEKMGIPIGVTGLDVNALPFRAYNLIWNTWFRDQNVQDSVAVNTDNGPDDINDYQLLYRGKRHDYFTSCLPWPQKGTAVDLPLGTIAPVVTKGGTYYPKFTTSDHANEDLYINTSGFLATANVSNTTAKKAVFGSETGLQADLSTATAATINQLREAFQVQSILELDARGGTRYVEILQAHFNVISPDFRLQRPEYLGGGEIKINSHIVPQTSPTSGSNAQGALAAFATGSTAGKNIGFTKSFVEHGYVIGLAAARGEITYQQGINRMWNRSTRFDFFWPKLQEIGEQAVLVKEIYAPGYEDSTTVFGYQERYAEYRYKPSEIHGEFRSDYTSSLDVWHLAQDFGSAPTLNEAFIQSYTPVNRVIAVANTIPLLADYWFDYKHARPMMTYSVPATLGRF